MKINESSQGKNIIHFFTSNIHPHVDEPDESKSTARIKMAPQKTSQSSKTERN